MRFLLPGALFAVMTLATGCGGGSALNAAGPVVSSPQITTAPSPLTAAGGTASIRVVIADTGLLNVTTSTPRVDVLDPSGTSAIGGPQALLSLNSDPSGWAIQVPIPANTTAATKVYRVIVTAQSVNGATGNTPFFAGGITQTGQ